LVYKIRVTDKYMTNEKEPTTTTAQASEEKTEKEPEIVGEKRDVKETEDNEDVGEGQAEEIMASDDETHDPHIAHSEQVRLALQAGEFVNTLCRRWATDYAKMFENECSGCKTMLTPIENAKENTDSVVSEPEVSGAEKSEGTGTDKK
jgi:hypothetical protein